MVYGHPVGLLELGGELGQPIGVARDEDQVVPAGRELTGELRPGCPMYPR